MNQFPVDTMNLLYLCLASTCPLAQCPIAVSQNPRYGFKHGSRTESREQSHLFYQVPLASKIIPMTLEMVTQLMLQELLEIPGPFDAPVYPVSVADKAPRLWWKEEP